MTVTALSDAHESFPANSERADATRVESLIHTHLPLVGHLVRDTLYRLPAHINRDDLVSAGMLALTRAAQSFDDSLGAPFGAYATIRIRGAIADELRGLDWATRGVRTKARQIDEIRAELTASLGKVPTAEELASASGFAVHEIDTVDANVQRASVLSLQALPVEASETLMPASTMQPEALLVRREQLGYLRDAIAELPERLRVVIEGHFFEQRLMTDMADELGVTASRISQLRSEALVMLRAALAALDGEGGRQTVPAGGGRAAAQAAYCAAVASRSTLADRLRTTTATGDSHEAANSLQVAN